VSSSERDAGADVVSPATLAVREARQTDAPFVAQLLTELGYPRDEDFARWQIRRLATRPDDKVLVAEQSGIVVGFVALHLTPLFAESGPVGRITAFCVSAARRSQGIGRQLLAAAESAARDAGCVRMEVTSRESRTRAHLFYARHGYVEHRMFFRKPLLTEMPSPSIAGMLQSTAPQECNDVKR